MNQNNGESTMDFLAARPTQFDGCLFRSKSEAMFAKYLKDCLLIDNFVYEPEFLRSGDWIPDFAIPCFSGDHMLFTWHIIEYKPARPTDAYLVELHNRINCIGSGNGRIGGADVIWVNWFGPGQGIVSMTDTGWDEPRRCSLQPLLSPLGNYGSECRDTIRHHRFDLA